MKATRHNGRSGTNSPSHNDRDFDVEKSEHIDPGRKAVNHYWDCYWGHRSGDETPVPISDNAALTFDKVEQLFYSFNYASYVEGQNARNEKARHPERNKSAGDLLHGKRTQPEETILQLGNIDETVEPDVLLEVMDRYQSWFEEQFGSHIHILDWAMHVDETTPHIHERHVYDFTNQYGELQPMQEKALEALGIERPDPEKPSGRNNNRKMSFDKVCREKFIEIAESMQVEIEKEPSYGGRGYMQKQDYIIASQKERIAAQEERLEELTMKVRDLDALVSEVTDEAYAMAVNELADTAVQEAVAQIGHAAAYLKDRTDQDPGKTPAYKSIAAKILGNIFAFIEKNVQLITARVRRTLNLPGTAARVKAPVKEKVRTSSLAKLYENAALVRQRDAERKQAVRTGKETLNRSAPER